MALVKDYFEKTEQYQKEYGEKTVVLMQVGAFFEIYGLKDIDGNITKSKLEEVSLLCDLIMANKSTPAGGQKQDKNQVLMAGFRDHQIDKYLKKLQENGWTVIVYVQDSPTKNTTRSLLGVFSPGTYFSNDIQTITNNSVCIWLEIKKSLIKKNYKEQIYIGASQIDILTGQTSLMEYNIIYNNNPTTFDELENYISIYNPSETIIITNLNYKQIEAIINFINLQSKTIHYVYLNEDKNEELKDNNIQRAKNCEKQNYCSSILQKFYKINDFNSFFEKFNDYVYATQSFCYLLDFIYKHNPNLIYKLTEPIIEHNGNKLILANQSIKQLNIIDDDNYKGKYSSVVKMLNECVTTMGKRKFNHNFLNPITNKNTLNKEYDITEHLLTKSETFKELRTMLSSLKDISKINRQILLSKVSPKLLYNLYTSLQLTKHIYNYIINVI